MTARSATSSRDGTWRFDLRIPVRLSLNDMAVAIALGSYEDAEHISMAGKARLLAWCRDGIRNDGMDHIRLGEMDGYEDEVAAAARRLVALGIFPAQALLDG